MSTLKEYVYDMSMGVLTTLRVKSRLRSDLGMRRLRRVEPITEPKQSVQLKRILANQPLDL